MTEMYKILGAVGWIWLPCALMFLLGYLKGERDTRRRLDPDLRNGLRGFDVKVNGSDEKQS